MFNLGAGLEINKGICHISGVSFYDLAIDVNKFYGTSVMSKYMFQRTTWDNFKMSEFFLVEMHYVLSNLLQLRNLRSNRKRLNQLKLLIEEKTWFKNTIDPINVPFQFSRITKYFKTKPYEKQMRFLEQYQTIRSSYHLKGLLLDSVAGSGKAQPYSSVIKVPGGWTTMERIAEGDLICSPDGTTATVLRTFEQGVTDVYEITTEDGRKVKCHPEHLWECYIERHIRSGGAEVLKRVLTLDKLKEQFKKSTIYLPLLKLYYATAKTTKGFDRIAYELMESDDIITDAILELPHDSRMIIVRSIMNEYGHVLGGKVIAADTTSITAAHNLRKLIWSIGGTCSFRIIRDGYRLVIKHSELEAIMDLGDIDLDIHSSSTRNARLKITEIKLIGKEPTKCIYVDSKDHLYITDDFIVTHNTFTGLAWSKMLNDFPTVAIVPKNLIESVWIEQSNVHFKEMPKIWTSLEDRPMTPGHDYYYIHYEYLSSHVDEIIKFLTAESKRVKGLFKLLLDESHNMNDIKAARTQALIKLADTNLFSDALPGSGTPLKALSKEAYTVMCLIDPLFKGKTRQEFLDVYGRSRERLNDLLRNRIGRSKYTIPELSGMEKTPPNESILVTFPGAEKFTLKAIRLAMQDYIYKRVDFYKKNMPQFLSFYHEVINDYTESIKGNTRLESELAKYKSIVDRFRTQGYNSFYDSEDSKFCKSVEEHIESDLKGQRLKDFRNVKSAVKYLNLKLTGEALGNVLGKARMEAVRQIIAHAGIPELIESVEKKTLIFTSYVEVLKEAEIYLTAKGYNVLTIYGGTNNERLAILAKFEGDDKYQVMVATFDSLKEGQPVLSANQEIFLNVPFRDYEMTQAKARIWRMGQDTNCFFWNIVLDTGNEINITSRSIDIMEWSAEQVNQLLPKEEGNALFGRVSGNEMLDMSFEPDTYEPTQSKSLLSLF